MPRITPRSSRRAAPLKDTDYDHQICLTDNAPEDDEVGTALETDAMDFANRSVSPAPGAMLTSTVANTGDGAADDAAADRDDASRRPSMSAIMPTSGEPALSPAVTASSMTPLLNTMSTVPTAVAGPSTSRSPSRGRHPSQYGSISKPVSAPLDATPSVQVEAATPGTEVPNGGSSVQSKQQQHQLGTDWSPTANQPGRQSMQSIRQEPEAAIDILFENERGGFLCGIPLFSQQALGNLDPSPWTTATHGTSPTDINTAQVPDPSWEWAWPEWRINRDEGMDEDGWEYSFMFAKCFSWHGPTWYSSFVRRRSWIRKRVKRKLASMSVAAAATGLGKADSLTDPHLLNPEYFTVVSAASMRRSSSRASSRMGSRLSLAAPSTGQSSTGSPNRLGGTSRDGNVAGGDGDADVHGDGESYDNYGEFFEMPKTITDADVLMRFLRAARIDREKIEAIDNFVQYSGEDLVRLQDYMHEIMTLFVFQASRRTLLTHLTEAHDAAVQTRQTAIDEAEEIQKKQQEKKENSPERGGEGAESHANSNSKDKETFELASSSLSSTSPVSLNNEAAPDIVHKLQALGRRVGYLAAAAKHADEEVRRLEYWSDIKAMAQRGAAEGAVEGEGWDAQKWQGVDQSGPAPPPPKEPTSKQEDTQGKQDLTDEPAKP